MPTTIVTRNEKSDMNTLPAYLGIGLVIIGVTLLIAGAIYNGMTGKMDGWFWGLVVSGSVITFMGFVLLVLALVWAKSEVVGKYETYYYTPTYVDNTKGMNNVGNIPAKSEYIAPINSNNVVIPSF